MHTCTCTHSQTHTHTHMSMHTNAHVHTHMHIHVHTEKHTFLHAFAHTHTPYTYIHRVKYKPTSMFSVSGLQNLSRMKTWSGFFQCTATAPVVMSHGPQSLPDPRGHPPAFDRPMGKSPSPPPAYAQVVAQRDFHANWCDKRGREDCVWLGEGNGGLRLIHYKDYLGRNQCT